MQYNTLVTLLLNVAISYGHYVPPTTDSPFQAAPGAQQDLTEQPNDRIFPFHLVLDTGKFFVNLFDEILENESSEEISEVAAVTEVSKSVDNKCQQGAVDSIWSSLIGLVFDDVDCERKEDESREDSLFDGIVNIFIGENSSEEGNDNVQEIAKKLEDDESAQEVDEFVISNIMNLFF